jgi:hypothetical protein
MNSQPDSRSEEAPTERSMFKDSMAKNWEQNWFLDGENATLEHRDGGLAFLTNYTVDKRVDRAGFDAQHAVLWTQKEFEGELRITYTFTNLPNSSWQSLIYVQAQGIGTEPYVKDIYAWRDSREVAVMSDYFKYMNLIGLSLRNEIRCKRYPWSDMDGNGFKTEFKPRGENKGFPEGRELSCVVEKRKESILLRIQDIESGEMIVDHTWDLTDPGVLEDRDLKFVEKGRIGLRHMGGFKALYQNFKVEQL